MARLKFSKFDNEANKRSLRACFKKVESVLPSWVDTVDLCQRMGADDCALSIEVCPAYRRALINVCPNFWVLSETERVWYMLHELMHAIQAEFTVWVETQLIETWREKNPQLYEFLQAERVAKEEQMNEELTGLVGRLLGLPELEDEN